VEPRPLLQRVLAPRSGLGVGWRSRLCTDAPLVFHAMPESLRLRVVRRHLGPAPGWFMKDRVVGRFPLHLGFDIRRIEERGAGAALHIESPEREARTVEADHVIATTDGAPALDRNFACSIPGLYFVGLASANSFGPLARFAYGAGFTARRLTKHLAASLRSARRHPRAHASNAAPGVAAQVDRS